MSAEAFQTRLSARAMHARVPLYGSIELTWRCNFACVHCYQEGLRDRHRELDGDGWCALLDEMADGGCLWLTITGGEPMVHPQFEQIYEHAIRRGFLVTLFTNGAAITGTRAKFLQRLPPRQVEITLYGADEATYAQVTQREGQLAKVIAGVDLLLAHGIHVILKAPVMTLLYPQLEALRALATARGLGFRADPFLTPRLDGNPAPLAYRLTAAEIVDLDAKDADASEAIRRCAAHGELGDDRLYSCGAARNAFNIDPSGNLVPCVISREATVQASGRFAAAWAELGPESSRSAPATSESCGGCAGKSACARCPGVSLLETGNAAKSVDFHCEVTARRMNLVGIGKRK